LVRRLIGNSSVFNAEVRRKAQRVAEGLKLIFGDFLGMGNNLTLNFYVNLILKVDLALHQLSTASLSAKVKFAVGVS
jgi:hypothetical protein